MTNKDIVIVMGQQTEALIRITDLISDYAVKIKQLEAEIELLKRDKLIVSK